MSVCRFAKEIVNRVTKKRSLPMNYQHQTAANSRKTCDRAYGLKKGLNSVESVACGDGLSCAAFLSNTPPGVPGYRVQLTLRWYSRRKGSVCGVDLNDVDECGSKIKNHAGTCKETG